MHDVQSAHGPGERDVQPTQAARLGRDDAGRLGDDDGVELEALGEGRRHAHQPVGFERVLVLPQQRGLETRGPQRIVQTGDVAVGGDQADGAFVRQPAAAFVSYCVRQATGSLRITSTTGAASPGEIDGSRRAA